MLPAKDSIDLAILRLGDFKMKKWPCLTGVIVLITIVNICMPTVHADTEVFYRLIDDHVLDIGNHWQYNVHVTEYPEYGTVDWTGTGTIDITKTETISGFETSYVYSETTLPVIGTDWSSSNQYFADDSCNEVRRDNSEERYTLRNNNPLETIPVWISTDYDNYRFGYGQHYGYLYEYDYTWSGYRYNYVTYLGNETVEVDAGTFDCTKVLLKEEFHEFAGLWGYYEKTEWYHPAVGMIKSSEYAYIWNPAVSSAMTGQLTSELESTNVTYPQDFDGDYQVTIADFALLASVWGSVSGDAVYDAKYDLYEDNVIDIYDLVDFADKWIVQSYKFE